MDEQDILEIFVGDTKTFPIEITQDASPYPLAGHTLQCLFSNAQETARLHQIDVTAHEDAANGESSVEVTPEDITTIGGAGAYWLTVVDIDGDGKKVTQCQMPFSIKDRPQGV